MSLKDLIYEAEDRAQIVPVPTPEWPAVNGKLFIRQMSGQDRHDWEISAYDAQGQLKRDSLQARMVVATVVDETGGKVFDGEADVEKLSTKSIVPIQRLFDVAMKLNAVSQSDIEEIVKNSLAIRSASGA